MDSARYIIDRIEDGEWAVLEPPEGPTLDVPRAWIPTDAAAGDVLHVTPSADADTSTVTFMRDEDATTERRERLQNRRDRLSSTSDGPISL